MSFGLVGKEIIIHGGNYGGNWSAFSTMGSAKAFIVGAPQEEILSAYRVSVDQLCQEYGFKSVDVISVKPDHPEKQAPWEKFLSEHTHSNFEACFFVAGKG